MSLVFSAARVEPADLTALALFERIGRDHALSINELGGLGREAGAAALWAAYDEHWRRFCGSRLDPQFWHLDHPTRWTGALTVSDAAPVVIVGTGPSLLAMLPSLRRVRAGVHLFTSPRGADALAEAGLVPDLVLVEHQTPLDAHFSARDLSHRNTRALTRVPLVAADARTPAAMLAGIPADRLFVPDPLPTWGVWPATAVALALASGAQTVALAGIDLGTSQRPDPAQAPLRAVLALLAAQTDVASVDVGTGGAPKPGWPRATLDAIATGGPARPLAPDVRPWRTADARLELAAGCWRRVAPLVAQAESTLAAACRVRDGDHSPAACADMEDSFARLLAAGMRVETRVDVQDGLGASFLPRFWRTSPDPALGCRLWRPAALAAHELINQHRSLTRRLARWPGTP
jgi:hypothetical protein